MAVMCGRYGRSSRLDAIEVYLDSLLRITGVEDWQTAYNAAPGCPTPLFESSRKAEKAVGDLAQHGRKPQGWDRIRPSV